MPTLHKSGSARIVMYMGDHPPPHVHVMLMDGRECTVNLRTGHRIGDIDTWDIHEQLAWIHANRARLIATWNAFNP